MLLPPIGKRRKLTVLESSEDEASASDHFLDKLFAAEQRDEDGDGGPAHDAYSSGYGKRPQHFRRQISTANQAPLVGRLEAGGFSAAVLSSSARAFPAGAPAGGNSAAL